MQLDDEVCLCFHVTKRKIQNFLRVERPRRVAQLSDCFGAGTGCGWCRKYLAKMFEAAAKGSTVSAEVTLGEEAEAADYAKSRSAYIKAGGGTPPPGATPIE